MFSWSWPLERVWGILFSFLRVVFSGFPMAEDKVPRTKSTESIPLSIFTSWKNEIVQYIMLGNDKAWFEHQSQRLMVLHAWKRPEAEKYSSRKSLHCGVLTCSRLLCWVCSDSWSLALSLTLYGSYTCSPEAPPTPLLFWNVILLFNAIQPYFASKHCINFYLARDTLLKTSMIGLFVIGWALICDLRGVH